jgi:hypothetical protein
MKGFIYLLEISIALILMLVVLGTISTFKSKENWERADLITTGNDIIKNLNYQNIVEFLNENFTKIQSLLPPNIDFGVKITGIPKSNITVGCVDKCDDIEGILPPAYVNGHWINFSVSQFNINSGIPSSYDAVGFYKYGGYSPIKSNITDYLNKGGVVIGVNDTLSNSNQDFNDIFGLSPFVSLGGVFNFSSYNPSADETEKYFLGIGFEVNTSGVIGSKKWGNLTLWDNYPSSTPRKINISSSGMVDVENKTVDEGLIQNVTEGGLFRLKGPDSIFYTFKVKKIFWDSEVIIQPLNSSFAFNDISERNVTGKFNIVTLSGGAEMTSNNTAVWISIFPTPTVSAEYMTLIRSAVASRVKEWYVRQPDLTKEYVSVSSFYSLCCDMPETAELTIYLWYKI